MLKIIIINKKIFLCKTELLFIEEKKIQKKRKNLINLLRNKAKVSAIVLQPRTRKRNWMNCMTKGKNSDCKMNNLKLLIKKIFNFQDQQDTETFIQMSVTFIV